MTTLPSAGSGENPSGERSPDEHSAVTQLCKTLRWVTADSGRTYRLALLLLISLSAVVAIVAFLSTPLAFLSGAIVAGGSLHRLIAKRTHLNGRRT
jgi:hypothetical protein